MNDTNLNIKKNRIGLNEIINMVSTFISALATAYIAYYTIKLSNISQEANYQSRLNSYIQLRAYIIQDIMRYDSNTYDVATASKNVGQTPAVEVTSHSRAMIADKYTIDAFLRQGIDEDLNENDNQTARSNMGPGSVYDFNPKKVPNRFTDGTFETLNNYTKDDISDFVNGKRVFWISGAIRYKDVYGQYHRTRFCYYFEKNFNVRTYCPKNNDMQ